MQNQQPGEEEESKSVVDNEEICNINMAFFNKKNKSFYVPSYLRIVVKNIKSLNFEFLEGSLNVTIVLNTNTWGLPQSVILFIEENIKMYFNRNQTLQLGKGVDHMVDSSVIEKMKNSLRKRKKEDDKQMKLHINKEEKGRQKKVKIGSKYTKRLTRNATVQPYVFFTPFQLIDLVISIELPDLKYEDLEKGQIYTVKFNIMRRQQLQNENLVGKMPIISKMISSSCTTDFGVYSIATKRMDVEYSSSRAHTTLMKLGKNFYNLHGLDHKREKVKERSHEKQSQSIKYGHFHIPISKNPLNMLTTLFIPLWLFSFINLSIFTLPPSLGSRIGAIATVMLAFVSLIPSIHEQIPTSPTFTVFQGLVYLQTVNSILCLFQSLLVQDENEDAAYDFMQNYIPKNDGMYLLSHLFTIMIIVIPVLMFLWYKIFLIKSHYIGKAENLAIDKSFEDWTSCDEGKHRFLNSQCRNSLIFADQDLANLVEFSKYSNYKHFQNSPCSSITSSKKGVNLSQLLTQKSNQLILEKQQQVSQKFSAPDKNQIKLLDKRDNPTHPKQQ